MDLVLTDKGLKYREGILESDYPADSADDFLILNHFYHGGGSDILEGIEGTKIEGIFKKIIRRLFEAGYLEEYR